MQTRAEFVEHAQTYHHFMLGLKWLTIHLAAVITGLVLWFATPAGFLGGAAGAIVVLAIGIYAMNHGLAHSTERDGPGEGGLV